MKTVNPRGFKLLSDKATMPTRGTSKSAGYDLYASEDVTVKAGATGLIKTDVSAYMDGSEVFILKSRSGLSYKQGVIVGAGVIDADYFPNPIGVVIHNWTSEDLIFEKGNKVAQGIFVEYRTTDDLPEEERVGGFGSTGK